jgi:hypothetical protein
MKPIPTSFASTIALVLTLGACVPAPRPSPPVETRTSPTPAPTVAPAPVVTDWMDAPQTPGDWRYAGGVAQFGESASEPRFSMRCEAASRTVVLSRAGQPSGTPRMTIRTEALTRTLAAAAKTASQPVVEARLAASDRLLDAMALSKGRFAVEVPGTPTLYIPSWAEVTRVIEDCR